MGRLSAADRLDALARAVELGDGALPADLVEAARAVEDRAGQRLRLSEDHTVVALAGATGSGKSSLLNALVGTDLAEVDVLRPTTSEALAVVRGVEGSGPLLDWLEVRRRHHLAEPDPAGARGPDGGLVLLDLPDHDSVRTEHRLEAERLVRLVDLMVWVLDPQKYADAAVHERYLRGLSSHADVVLVVLNQVDRLTAEERRACRRDLERLLADDGLTGVGVLELSARTGEGVPALVRALDDAAARRVAARARVLADVSGLAGRVLELCGTDGTARPPRAAREELVASLSDAAGVPVVVEAVRSARVLHARRATGWPVTRWLSRLRVDPVRRLHLRPETDGEDPAARTPGLVRTSVPAPGPAELARARTAVRDYTDAATAGAGDPWVLAARRRTAPLLGGDVLADELDRAVGSARVTTSRRPAWWGVVGALQWLLLVALVGGLVWLGALAGLDALRLPAPEPPRWGEVPWPTVAAVGGAVLGLLLAGLARALAAVGARRHARRATAQLRAAVTEVGDRLVVDPVAAEMDRLAACREAARRAAGGRS